MKRTANYQRVLCQIQIFGWPGLEGEARNPGAHRGFPSVQPRPPNPTSWLTMHLEESCDDRIGVEVNQLTQPHQSASKALRLPASPEVRKPGQVTSLQRARSSAFGRKTSRIYLQLRNSRQEIWIPCAAGAILHERRPGSFPIDKRGSQTGRSRARIICPSDAALSGIARSPR